MKLFKKPYMIERVLYIIIWVIVFFVPVVIVLWPSQAHFREGFDYALLLRTWGIGLLPYLLLFVINSLYLVPRLLFRKKYVQYIAVVFGLLMLFAVSKALIEPEMLWRKDFRPKNMPNDRPPFEGDSSSIGLSDFMNGVFPNKEEEMWDERPHRPIPRENKDLHPQRIIVRFAPLLTSVLLAALMIGFNVAVKLMFKSVRDEERMKELEKSRLQTELTNLKYQISPHFFMNTLNNIHALVDIDSGQAQKAIVDLSKMMRYVLYETDREQIALSREIQFIENYIELMRLRYTDKVLIKTSFPDDVPPVNVPPLLYISFAENAFKHGVSYQHQSEIFVGLEVTSGTIVFVCSNTNKGKKQEQQTGIGLDNIQKRLKLLYGCNFKLTIDDNTDYFTITLTTPI